jgi:hypothetical protein
VIDLGLVAPAGPGGPREPGGARAARVDLAALALTERGVAPTWPRWRSPRSAPYRGPPERCLPIAEGAVGRHGDRLWGWPR